MAVEITLLFIIAFILLLGEAWRIWYEYRRWLAVCENSLAIKRQLESIDAGLEILIERQEAYEREEKPPNDSPYRDKQTGKLSYEAYFENQKERQDERSEEAAWRRIQESLK